MKRSTSIRDLLISVYIQNKHGKA